MRRFRFIILLATTPVILGQARTLYISSVGTNDETGFYPDWAGAAANIQYALNLATNSDQVWVTNNLTYAITTNIVVTNGISLRSWTNGALDPTNTILDGGGVARCLYINNTNALVTGFTITNGNGIGNSSGGGGVYIGGAVAAGGTRSQIAS